MFFVYDFFMTSEIAYALYGYFEVLYKLNQKLIKLCGIDAINENGTNDILDIIQDIPRIVPYSLNRETGKLEFKDDDGLLEYSNTILYLKQDYKTILSHNYDFLNSIRKVRNKYEHKMHGIKMSSMGSGSLSLFDFTFKVNGKEIELTAGKFINLVKEINILFSKISSDISEFAYANNFNDYLYYQKLSKFEFNDFNTIYDSNILRTIGKIMKDF